MSAEGLNNSGFTTYNTVANWLSRKTGDPAVVKFETDKKAVVDELTRAWRQAGGSEGDIKSWSAVLDASGSPKQLHAAIGEMGHLLEGKLAALESQYQQGMGTTDTTGMRVVTPAARAVLSKIEQKATGTTAGASAPTTSGRVRVTGPNGEHGTVPATATLPPGWTKD